MVELTPYATLMYTFFDRAREADIFVIDDKSFTSIENIRKAMQYYYAQESEVFPYQRSQDFYADLSLYVPLDNVKWRLTDEGANLTIHCYFLKQALEYDVKLKIKRTSDRREDMLHYFRNLIQNVCWMSARGCIADHEKRLPRLRQIMDDQKCLALVTAPGLGKTNAIVEYIQELPKETPVLVISFRIALSEKQMADFQGMGFKHYAKVPKYGFIRLHELNRLVIQVDSLLRITTKVSNLVLVLDEWESLVEHLLTSPYITRKAEIIERLVSLIAQSRTVLIADANYSQGSDNFFRNICNLEPRIYFNDYIRNPRQASFFAGKGQLTRFIITNLREGKKIYVPTNSKNYGKYLRRKILKDPYLGPQYKADNQRLLKIYSSETVISSTQDPVDPIQDMINYDCCIVTPKFQAGNSFTADHFDLVCGYFSAASCSPEASAQLLMRVRNVRNPHSYFCVLNQMSARKKVLHEVSTIDDMIKYLVDKEALLNTKHQLLSSYRALTCIRLNYRTESLSLDEPLNYLAISCAVNLNEGHKNYARHFVNILHRMGFEMAMYHDEGARADRQANIEAVKEMKEIREEEEKMRILTITQAPDSTADEIDELNQKGKEGKLSPSERARITKYHLLRVFDLQKPHDPEVIRKALALKSTKRLMNRLYPFACTNDEELEKKCLESVLNDLAGCPDDSPPRVRQFYDMDTNHRALVIGYLLSFVRALGFSSFFDPRVVNIDKNYLLEYMKAEDRYVTLEKLFDKKFTPKQVTADGILKWLNTKLAILGISVKRTNRHTNRAHIESPWRLIVVNNRVTVQTVDLEIDINQTRYMCDYPQIIEHLTLEIKKERSPVVFNDITSLLTYLMGRTETIEGEPANIKFQLNRT